MHDFESIIALVWSILGLYVGLRLGARGSIIALWRRAKDRHE